MKYFNKKSVRRRKLMPIFFVVIVFIALVIAGGALLIRQNYQNNLRPVSLSIKLTYFTVEAGNSSKEIATKLEQAGLIRSSSAFNWYVRQQGLQNKLLAGTYSLNPSLSSQEIAGKMVRGEITKNLVTILPGKRLDQIQKILIDNGFSSASVTEALKPSNYKGHPALIYLPAGASLEGYIYPDSYEKISTTSAQTIIGAALDEMAKKLTAERAAGFQRQGLTVHQAVTLASIIDQEVSNPNDKPTVAQVFIKRLHSDMVLGSDVTAYYASKLAGKPESVTIDSPYNTRVYKGLPPGPIGNVTSQALDAVANPSTTDYLFFVAGDDGETHFSHTEAEHEQLTRKYCTKLCN